MSAQHPCSWSGARNWRGFRILHRRIQRGVKICLNEQTSVVMCHTMPHHVTNNQTHHTSKWSNQIISVKKSRKQIHCPQIKINSQWPASTSIYRCPLHLWIRMTEHGVHVVYYQPSFSDHWVSERVGFTPLFIQCSTEDAWHGLHALHHMGCMIEDFAWWL